MLNPTQLQAVADYERGLAETERPLFRRECSWCQTYLGGDPESKHVTHGVCITCKEQVLKGTYQK